MVVLVDDAKLPFGLLFVQVTVFPDVATALPFTSASCAVIVTVPPATGEVLEDVTRYFVAGPAAKTTVSESAIATPFKVPVIVAVPAVTGAVNVAVYDPFD